MSGAPADFPTEIVHTYEYHSSHAPSPSILNLRQMGTDEKCGFPPGARPCEFISTGGGCTEPHGSWCLDDDHSKLIVHFNCRYLHGADGDLESRTKLHPCILYRIDSQLPSGATSNWSGMDDKCAVIHLVHIRSVKKSVPRSWHLTDAL